MGLDELPALELVVKWNLGGEKSIVILYNPETDPPIHRYRGKFVELGRDRTYVFAAAPPSEDRPDMITHQEVEDIRRALPSRRGYPVGGGSLTIRDGCLYLDDSSERYGKFNRERVEPVVREFVKKHMPYIKEIIVE